MQGIIGKMSIVLLVVMAVGFAAAPSWVAKGASLAYTVGNGTVTFNVANVSGEDLKIEVTPSTTGKMYKATENGSADSGQFWFDSSLLAAASTGSTVGDYSVTGTDTQTFAGKSWNTITLEETLDGAKTTKVYDKSTGLLLKQTVDSEGVPAVTLASLNIPGFTTSAVTATAPPAQSGGQQNASPATTAENTSEAPAAQTNGTSGAQQEGASTGGEQQATQEPAGSSGAQPEEKGKCASGAILLALLGAAFCLKK